MGVGIASNVLKVTMLNLCMAPLEHARHTVEVTLVTGELDWGRRTQELPKNMDKHKPGAQAGVLYLPWSTPLIQSSWKVA